MAINESSSIETFVDAAADRFEAAWRSGSPPRLADFVAHLEGDRRRAVLAELARIDLWYCHKNGLPSRLDEHLRDFPELSQVADELRLLESQLKQPPRAAAEDEAEYGPGATIGKYKIVETIALATGQAKVYRAIHPTLGTDVVLKVGRHQVAPDDALRDALVAEGRILADLNHPGIPRVYDVAFVDQHPYVVMEFIRGQNLRQYTLDRAPGPNEIARLLAQAARALAVAHQRGIIHRDLKPQNMLVDDAGRVWVIDFGLARWSHAWLREKETTESTGGTLCYMPPEQASGDAAAISQRSDIFSLGATLYHLLLGKPPISFVGASSLRERLVRVRQCEVDHVSLAKAKVPGRLKAICARSLQADPDKRHRTASEFAAELESFLRRKRRIAVTLACLFVGLLLPLGWKTGLFVPSNHSPGVELGPKIKMNLRVRREGQWYSNFASVVPLESGDGLKMSAEIPEDMVVSLFEVNGQGRLKQLKEFFRQGDLLYFPSLNKALPVEGPQGTEFLLLCARRAEAVDPQTIERLWNQQTTWPALPRNSLLHMTNEEVIFEKQSRDFGEPQAPDDPEMIIYQRLQSLRAGLRGYCKFDGVAFPHVD